MAPWLMMVSQSSHVLHNLKSITLKNCRHCEQIPPLGHFPSLEFLEVRGIGRCGALVKMSRNLRTLTQLEFYDVQNFGIESAVMDTQLKFYDVQNFEIESVVRDLLGKNTLLLTASLGKCDLFYLCIRGLASLTSLDICDCEKLRALELWTPALHELNIAGCPALTSLSIGDSHQQQQQQRQQLGYFPWPSYFIFPLNSVKRLSLYGWEKLNSLPEPPTQTSFSDGPFPSVTSLELSGFGGLQSVPEWIGNFPKLQSLFIFNCGNLKILPSARVMQQRLSKLDRLEIKNCPLLKERCRPPQDQDQDQGGGPEWDKISHLLPNIVITD